MAQTSSELPPLEELHARKERLEKELQLLSQSFAKLKDAQDLFVQNIATLSSLGSIDERTELLIPLTSSVFTVGKLLSTSTVMVDIGTGYYVEKVSLVCANQLMSSSDLPLP
jgi:prefoldin alpha subunit